MRTYFAMVESNRWNHYLDQDPGRGRGECNEPKG